MRKREKGDSASVAGQMMMMMMRMIRIEDKEEEDDYDDDDRDRYGFREEAEEWKRKWMEGRKHL